MTKIPKWIPKKQIEIVLRRDFVNPFMDSMGRDPVISLKLSNALVLLNLSEQLIVEFDSKEIDAGKNVENIKEKNLFLGYLAKVYKSALLLIGATDYLGAMVLLRSIFELLVGIATEKNGPMKQRISSIEFLDDKEKNNLHELWNELNAWAHPYGKWVKNICPKFYGIGRNYHPLVFKQCLNYSDEILDMMLTITIDHFKIVAASFIDKYRQIFETADILEISRLHMFEKRVTRTP
jgi:hypothetical protein